MEPIRASASPSRPPLKIVYLGDSLTQGDEDGFTLQARQEQAYAQLMSRALGVEPNAAYISKGGIPLNPFVNGAADAKNLEYRKDRLTVAMAPLAAYTWYVGVPFVVPPVFKLGGEGVRTHESRDTPEHPQNNFAVPGNKARHLLTIRNEKDMLAEIHAGLLDSNEIAHEVPLTRAVLQNGGVISKGSQIDRAVAANPDVVMLWAGANDELPAIYNGVVDDATLTPIEDKRYTYQCTNPLTKAVEHRTSQDVLPGFQSVWTGENGILPRLLNETSAEIFFATVPHGRVTPAMATLGRRIGPLPFRVVLKDGTDATQDVENWVIPTGIVGPGKDGRTQFPAGTKVLLFTALLKLVMPSPLHSLDDLHKAMTRASGDALLTENEVSDPDEIAQVDQRDDEFNAILKQAAATNPRLHLVDADSLLDDINTHGRMLRGTGPDVKVTGTFTGVQRDGMEGIFSFDGIHPSDTGYAVVANVMLDRMRQDLAGNPRFAAVEQAQPIDEKAVFATDPHRINEKPAVMLERSQLGMLQKAARA